MENTKYINQRGSALLIVLVLVVIGAVAYFGYQYMGKGKVTRPDVTTTTTEQRVVNLEEGRKLNPAQVKITSSGFIPATVEIKAGQSVTWVNEDNVSHQLTSDSKNPEDSLSETDPIEVKEVMSFPFTTPGTINYMDSTDPTLKGIIIVK